MQKILVALDGTARQKLVLDAAIDLARSFAAELVLMHAISIPVGVPKAALSISPDAVLQLLQEEATANLIALRAEVPMPIKSRYLSIIETPWRAICETAVAENVDCIVLGTHSHGAIERLLGTTANQVINHSKVSVFVVR